MGEMDRLNNNMQKNFDEIFRKLDILEERQVENKKDIEYIKKEINGKLDKRIDDKIEIKLLTGENLKFKENKKTWFAIITSGIALIGSLINLFLG